MAGQLKGVVSLLQHQNIEGMIALIHCHFFSQVLDLASTMSVIHPDPVVQVEETSPAFEQHQYPTLYLLHGLSDDHTIWQRRTSIERYVEGLDLAVVMPAVHCSYYKDTVTGQDYWAFISEEIPPLACNFFPLSELRDDNYVAGILMGGYGAFKLALAYPERYAAAASLSGMLDVVLMAEAELEAGEEELKHIFGDASALAGSSNDLFYLAEQVVARGGTRPRLYQWWGTDDFLYEDNVRFRDHAQALCLDVV